MKKLMMALAMTAALGAFAEVKIATVDMTKLVKNHPSYAVNKATLTSAESDYQKQIDQLKNDCESIQTEGRKLATEAQNPMLAATAKTDLEKKLMEVQERFLAAQQKLRDTAMSSQQKLSEMEGRLLKAQTDDILAKISAFAKSNGYDLVMDSGKTIGVGALPSVLFADDGLDVTDQILKALGVDPAGVKNEGK